MTLNRLMKVHLVVSIVILTTTGIDIGIMIVRQSMSVWDLIETLFCIVVVMGGWIWRRWFIKRYQRETILGERYKWN